MLLSFRRCCKEKYLPIYFKSFFFSRFHRSIPLKRVFHVSFILCLIKERGIGEIISGIGGMRKLAHKSAVKQGHCMFLVIEMMF